MMSMYGKCREISSARKVFDRFEPRNNAVIWTAMLAAYTEHGSLEESLNLFLDMQYKEDVVPNESTFCVLLTVTAKLFSMRCGNLLHALAEKTGFTGHKNVEDALIDMYSRTGDIKAAEKVFLAMTNYRDTTTWNTMINGYCYHGLGNESLGLFQEMLRFGEEPNDATFVGVLSACGHVGNVEQGFYYLYDLMQQKGVKPGLDHYMCIINMLIKVGQVNEALSFIASTRVAKLIPDDVASELMDIKKEERGMSWVEIGDKTYVFDAVDKGDPEFVEYHGLMKIIFASIRFFFHMRGSFDVDVDCNGYLSEEIAVAFSLMNTHVKAPICVIKSSGKINGGCHTFMKVLSKVTVRLITVRDAYHFHHFKDGRCSCADYW